MNDEIPATVGRITLDDVVEARAREIAREEMASFAGLMLRRLQDMGPTRSPERNMAVGILSELFGEALNDFGKSESGPGE